MKQTDIVKKHIEKYGSISPLEAQSNYNIWRLAAVVHKLRVFEDMDIITMNKTAPSGAKYAEYRLSRGI